MRLITLILKLVVLEFKPHYRELINAFLYAPQFQGSVSLVIYVVTGALL